MKEKRIFLKQPGKKNPVNQRMKKVDHKKLEGILNHGTIYLNILLWAIARSREKESSQGVKGKVKGGGISEGLPDINLYDEYDRRGGSNRLQQEANSTGRSLKS